MDTNPSNIFAQLQDFEKTIIRLEEQILRLEERVEMLIQIERNHLIRVKNREDLSDEFIYHGGEYLDLSPDKAWKLYNNKNYHFILLDVSSKDFTPPHNIPEAIRIPWEELSERFMEINSRITPILIISEDGTNSILACEFLAKLGYYNCSNISGGHKFWPATSSSKE